MLSSHLLLLYEGSGGQGLGVRTNSETGDIRASEGPEDGSPTVKRVEDLGALPPGLRRV